MIRCRKKIAGGMPRWKRKSWGTAVWSTRPSCLNVIPPRSAMGRKTWNGCPRTRPQTASEKKGGRKKASLAQPDLLPAIEALIEQETAGSPVDENIRWTNRSPQDLAGELQAQGFEIGPDALRRILYDELGLSRRQAFKDESECCFPQRDEQFQYIEQARAKFERDGWPVLSIDTKKKEILGNFFHPGRAFTDGRVVVRDHDFVTAEQRLVPYGVFDTGRNEGFLY